jgi:hypothetical protein
VDGVCNQGGAVLAALQAERCHGTIEAIYSIACFFASVERKCNGGVLATLGMNELLQLPPIQNRDP